MTISDLPRRAARRVLYALPWRRYTTEVRAVEEETLPVIADQVVEPEPRPSVADQRVIAEIIGAFDADWYLRTYLDVAASGLDPFTHYMDFGWREMRQPARRINIESCASLSPDFRPGQDNPLEHLLRCLDNPLLRERIMQANSPERTSPFPRNLEDGLCISGYLCSEIGLGQAARNLVYACDAVRLPVSSRSLPLQERENDREFASKCNPIVDRKAQVIVTGLPGVEHLRHELAPGRMNVLLPFWELGKVPPELYGAIRDYDEVWAPSKFIAAALSQVPDLVVHYVPQPVRLPRQLPPPRADRTTLRFFTYLDFDSFVARKNPVAAVNAFRAAFPPSRRDVELVVKTRGERDEGLRQWLGGIASQDDRIQVMDRTLDRAGMDVLMAECDAFISLHRSEGFGFGAAEAIAAGKAVVATNFGGTTDFINEQTGYPVDFTLEPVRPGEYVWTEGQVWATANADMAVEALRTIYAAPTEAEERARRGFALLQDQHALAIVGQRIERILSKHGLI